MIVIPEIYIKNQKAVPIEGTKNGFFNEDPFKMSIASREAGTQCIFMVDTNSTPTGMSPNIVLISKMIKETKLDLFVAGNFKSISSITSYFSAGAKLLILDAAAYREPKLLKEACDKFPGRIAVSIDVRNGVVEIPGWTVAAHKTPIEYANGFKDVGVRIIVYSDTNESGSMDALSLERIEKFCDQTTARVYLRHTINSSSDIENVMSKEIKRLDGLIISHPLYKGTMDLRAVIDMVMSLEKTVNTEPTMTEM